MAFSGTPTIVHIEKSPSTRIQKSRKMARQLYEVFGGSQVTDDMLAEAALLFNENYGIWGERAAETGPFARPGKFSRIVSGSIH